MAELINLLLVPSIREGFHCFREGMYWFRVRRITKNVGIEKEKLISNLDLVLEKVEATNKTEKVNDGVLEWLNDAEKLIEEEEKLEIEMETDRLNMFFIGLWFLGSERRCRVYHEILEKMKKLNNKCKFEPFSSPAPSLEYFSSGYFVCFESTKKTSDQLMEALQDDSSRIIGLYGKRGSGKTKLAEAVGEKAKYLRIFNEVVFVTVFHNSNIVGRIQDQIADSLDLTFDRNSEVARAKAISSKIKRKDRILVILDDVRSKLELKDIGIPINGNWCKVLLTTRRQQECTFMDSHVDIPLHPLSEEEAWTLLKKHSGINDESSSSNLFNVAREVVNECKGLPSTIKDVGYSFKGQSIEEWKALLDSLRQSARYQIFLSFKGDDTRYTFTGFLYDALCREGFKTFMDDGGLEGGDQISQTLISAIEASRLSIVVLSENYAKSAWCLDELVKILECMKTKNQLVWPVFYKVEPSDVRHQKNSYEDAMIAHENRFVNDSEKIQRWRSALFEVAGLSGMAYSNGYEHKFVQRIVEKAKNNRNRLYVLSTDMD